MVIVYPIYYFRKNNLKKQYVHLSKLLVNVLTLISTFSSVICCSARLCSVIVTFTYSNTLTYACQCCGHLLRKLMKIPFFLIALISKLVFWQPIHTRDSCYVYIQVTKRFHVAGVFQVLRWRQNAARTNMWLPRPCVNDVLTAFNVFCDLLLKGLKATWNL